MARAKSGEGMTARLIEREKRAKATLARIEEQKRQARDKVTGKTKAQAYVQKWLEKLTATELRHECEIRGFLYKDFETMEQAMDTVQATMFLEVVVQVTYHAPLEDGERESESWDREGIALTHEELGRGVATHEEEDHANVD